MPLRPVLLVALLARLAAAQAPATTLRAAGAAVSGAVHDSLARAPLAGATVQIASIDGAVRFGRMVVADSAGRFTIDDVPDGRYALGFFHPMLDSLGVAPPLREVHVNGQRPVRADLAIPSPARLRAAICGPTVAPDSNAVVVGVVRDASDRAAVAGASVIGDWLELSFRAEGIVRRVPRLVATTAENGWFAICNVPRGGTMALMASRGADSTDRIEVQVPADGFLRRELYLGPARTMVIGDTAAGGDPLAAPPRRRRLGDGRLHGSVVTAVEGQPLAGAQVSLTDGPQTRTNERGEWSLVDVPGGTRMLEVRAVGFYPDRRRVDVVGGAPFVRVALATFKSVLDTVKVTAARYNRDRNGFEQRRRTGTGRFLTPEDIARRQPLVMSELFRMIPGIRLEHDAEGFEQRLLMRGALGSCSPTIFLDGLNMMEGLTAAELDTWVRPREVAGVEIYSEGTVPAQYQRAMIGCGSIVIWTKK